MGKTLVQPCSSKRQLRMFPKVTNRQLKAKLTPSSPLWQQLPSQFKQVVMPSLPGWKGCTKVTLMVIATACLTALFVSLRYEPMRAGHWMVKATAGEKEQLLQGQLSKGYHKDTDCLKWWKAFSSSTPYLSMSEAQRDALNQEAAMALFLNPPVSPFKGGKSKVSCMCLRVGKAAGKHIEWDKEYPNLILQHAGVTDDGSSFPKISVPVHQLVAWLFLGPKPEGQVVCHNDLPPPLKLAVEWATSETQTYRNRKLLPVVLRCLSKNCVCPLCLQYGTQSQNAQTGREKQQLVDRRSRMKSD